MEPANNKQALRLEMKQRKREYTPAQLLQLSDAIANRLGTMAVFRQASCIALYHALPDEVQTAALLEACYPQKTILLPVVEGDTLRLVPYRGADSLQIGAFGIAEPLPTTEQEQQKEIQVDLIIVPGVAFDRQGNRLGRGKGFYDRLLSELPATKVGICFGFQLCPKIPTEPFDFRMDYLVTESEVLAWR